MKAFIILLLFLLLPVSALATEYGMVGDVTGTVSINFSDKVVKPMIGDWVTEGMSVQIGRSSSIAILVPNGMVVKLITPGQYLLTSAMMKGQAAGNFTFKPSIKCFEYALMEILDLFGPAELLPPSDKATLPSSQYPVLSGEKADVTLTRTQSYQLNNEISAVSTSFGLTTTQAKTFMQAFVYFKHKQYHKMLQKLYSIYAVQSSPSKGIRQLISISLGNMGLAQMAGQYYMEEGYQQVEPKEDDGFPDF